MKAIICDHKLMFSWYANLFPIRIRSERPTSEREYESRKTHAPYTCNYSSDIRSMGMWSVYDEMRIIIIKWYETDMNGCVSMVLRFILHKYIENVLIW